MNGKPSRCRRGAFALFAWILLAAAAGAQPPALMHYQGRLTNSSGTPIATAQTVYFSLWVGGSATVAGSGTQKYREHATITPSATGIFEHLIGSGTADLLTLNPADFNTATPIYLQVEVGSPGPALLPRAQMTSVGYAFIAARSVNATTATYANSAVIATTANYATTAGSATNSGTPHVTSVTDKTGGNVVIGDLLQISGTGLAGAKVMIGGKSAPIASASDTTLVCQVPAGTPMGYNPVAVIDAANTLASVTVAHVNVHRLLVWVSVGTNPQIIVADALTRQSVAQFTVSMGTDSAIPHLQMAFANEGSLAIVPSNYNGSIYAIDLTANPPALVTANCGAIRANAVAVSPDNYLATVSDPNGNRLLLAQLTKSVPPYAASPFGSFSTFSPTSAATPYTLSAPRGAAFIGNSLLMVCSTGNNRLYAFRRTAGTSTFSFYNQQNLASPNANIVNMLTTAGASPFAIYPSRDLTRIEVLTRATNNLEQYYVAPEGFGDLGDSLTVGNNAWGVAASADGNTLFVADSAKDLLHQLNATTSPVLIGDMENVFDPSSTFYDYQLAALEPVDGRQLAVGTDNYKLYFLTRDGGTLAPLATLTASGSYRMTYELQYQP